jgi:hypothetical protein
MLSVANERGLRAAMAIALQNGCVLRGNTETVCTVVFVPKDDYLPRDKPRAGKIGVISYALCADCSARPDRGKAVAHAISEGWTFFNARDK